MWLLALPLGLMLLVLIAWPLVIVLLDSFVVGGAWSLGNYGKLLSSGFYLQSFINTVGISLITTVIGMAIGFLIAVCLRRISSPVRRIAMAFANIGANFAGVPLAMALIILLGLNGALTLFFQSVGLLENFNVYSATGLIVAYCYFQIALATLLVTPALDGVDRELEEAAMLLGVGPVRFWQKIGLAVVSRQLLAIATLLFANAMGTFATTVALTGTSVNIVSIRISELVSGDVFSDPSLANAIAIALLLLLVLPIVATQYLVREGKR